MDNFTVTIRECSVELTPRERLRLKDISNAVKLDTVANDEHFVLAPQGYAILDVHNEKSSNPDYVNYIIFDPDGKKYVTGSPSFWNAFTEIWNEMSDTDEPYEIEVYKLDSKNYAGKKFLTCSII